MIKKIVVVMMMLMLLQVTSAEATNNEQKNSGNIIDVPEYSRFVELDNGLVRYDHVVRINPVKSNNPIKPDKPDNPNKPDKTPKPSYFDYRLMGASWWVAEDFQVSGSELDSQIIQTSLDTWDNEVRNFNVFGNAIHNPSTVRGDYLDNINSVTFEDLNNSYIIAYASTWYYFYTGEIVESDVVFNTYFDWSTSGEAGKMDLQNIATHELGHSLGLLDLYYHKSSENTMYGFSGYGETKKQSLEYGDILGIHALYGK